MQKVNFFDVDQTQLDFGRLMLCLIRINHDRDGLVQSLYGRSMQSFSGRGRLLGASNMMDFLDQPSDPNIQRSMAEKIELESQELAELYKDTRNHWNKILL